jgi:hypothetical protein
VHFFWGLGFWTTSSQGVAFLQRTYFFLFVSLFILPTFNIGSIAQMVMEYYKGTNEGVQVLN